MRYGKWVVAIILATIFAMEIVAGASRGLEHDVTAKSGRDARQDGVLVFYANETPRDAVSSANYQLLFDALHTSGISDAARVIRALTQDAEIFPALLASSNWSTRNS